MLHSTKDLEGYGLSATDGIIGNAKDFYFDDQAWVIRYVIVDTGSWLASRRVLISPLAIGRPNSAQRTFPISTTMERVKNSPDIDTDKPVSRQHEMEYLGYYGYPYYWGGGGLWGAGMYPGMMMTGYGGATAMPLAIERDLAHDRAQSRAEHHSHDDPHLRSCNAVTGYHIHASDGEIGHVDGLLVDESTWAIRYIVVNTSNWWLGHKVLIAPSWIQHVSWSKSTVSVNMTRQAVQDSPPYDSAAQLDREHEVGIHEHYGRTGYWAHEAEREVAGTLR